MVSARPFRESLENNVNTHIPTISQIYYMIILCVWTMDVKQLGQNRMAITLNCSKKTQRMVDDFFLRFRFCLLVLL